MEGASEITCNKRLSNACFSVTGELAASEVVWIPFPEILSPSLGWVQKGSFAISITREAVEILQEKTWSNNLA